MTNTAQMKAIREHVERLDREEERRQRERMEYERRRSLLRPNQTGRNNNDHNNHNDIDILAGIGTDRISIAVVRNNDRTLDQLLEGHFPPVGNNNHQISPHERFAVHDARSETSRVYAAAAMRSNNVVDNTTDETAFKTVRKDNGERVDSVDARVASAVRTAAAFARKTPSGTDSMDTCVE